MASADLKYDYCYLCGYIYIYIYIRMYICTCNDTPLIVEQYWYMCTKLSTNEDQTDTNSDYIRCHKIISQEQLLRHRQHVR